VPGPQTNKVTSNVTPYSHFEREIRAWQIEPVATATYTSAVQPFGNNFSDTRYRPEEGFASAAMTI